MPRKRQSIAPGSDLQSNLSTNGLSHLAPVKGQEYILLAPI